MARDEASNDSDVDLPDGVSLFHRSELKQAPEDLLQQPVDLIRRRNLKPSMRERVEAEAIRIG